MIVVVTPQAGVAFLGKADAGEDGRSVCWLLGGSFAGKTVHRPDLRLISLGCLSPHAI